MTYVCAVVVTFNPDLARLAKSLEAIRIECNDTVIVDNASSIDRRPDACVVGAEKHALILNPVNEGLGAALNAGAAMASRRGATHFLFLDQDSIPGLGAVTKLLNAFSAPTHCPVGAVGPSWQDPRTGQQSAGSERRGDARFLITSGMLVSKDVFQRIGPFEEGLFIDSTDLEWCFRARSMGYRLLSVPEAHLEHQLGERPVRILGRVLPGWSHHSPQRLYFMMRNRVLLYRKSYVPLSWKFWDIFRAFGKLFAFSILFPPRLTNARWMLTGLRDGLMGKSGPLKS